MSNYNDVDIYVLYNMMDTPVLKGNVNKLATKGDFFLYLDTKKINIHASISRLLKAGLIRENTPKEFLKYLTVSDIKQLLNKKGSLSKDLLVLEAETITSDKEIIDHPKYKVFYVISDLGSEILKKYKNLLLFFDKSRVIFGYGETNGRFNTPYFFKNYNHDPLDEIFNYYKDKDPDIAGRTSYIKENYDTAIYYAIQSISKRIMGRIDELINRSYFFGDFSLAQMRSIDSWIVETFSRKELSEYALENLIRQEYDKNFEYRELFTYDLFEKIQLAVMINESEELIQLTSKVNKLISDKYFPQADKPDSKYPLNKDEGINIVRSRTDAIEEYYKDTAKDLALLDLLIGHLDLELLYGLRNRIDIMIDEWEETLGVDEQTFFEDK